MNCDCAKEEITVLRKINKTQREVNAELRRQLRANKEECDGLVEFLCESLKAEEAMGELWERGGFDCDPEDYGSVVMRCLDGLESLREGRETPSPLLAALAPKGGLPSRSVASTRPGQES